MTTHKDFNGSTLQVVPVAEMFVPSYQRDLKLEWVTRIQTDWQASLFRSPTLSKRDDGRYAIVDGYHTIEAAKGNGHLSVPCLVYEGWSVQQEAAEFIRLNSGRRRPEAFDLYRAGLVAREGWALTLAKLAYDRGLRVDKWERNEPENTLRAIGALRGLIEHHQTGAVGDALDIILEAFPADEAGVKSRLERPFIVGLVDLIVHAKAKGEFTKADWVRKLRASVYEVDKVKVRVTPDGFANYLSTLISNGTIVLSNVPSTAGQKEVYAQAFGAAILGRAKTRAIYANT